MHVPWPTVRNASALAGLGIAAIGCSSVLFYHALQRVGASRTSAMNIALTALTAAVGGALYLAVTESWTAARASLGWHHAAALGLVVAGAWMLARPVPRGASLPARQA